MNLFSIFIALLIERSFHDDLSRWRSFAWLEDLHAWLQQLIPAQASRQHAVHWQSLTVLVSLLLPLMVLQLVVLLSSALVGGWIAAVISLLVLLYCLGPADLLAQCQALITASDSVARQQALDQLGVDRHVGPDSAGDTDRDAVIHAVFRAALVRWFSSIFWFALTGMFGVLFYRLCERLLAAQPDLGPDQGDDQHWLVTLRWLLEWPAAQLMVLLLAFAADFDLVYANWRNHAQRQLLRQQQHGFMLSVASQQVNQQLAAGASPHSDQQHVVQQSMRLLQRMLMLLLIGMLLLVLLGWIL
ncbi:MAG: cobalamin biosynthesis protein [Gammaproteobacteria bacterium]|jgi:AmpE protein|nr:cobalamin biosynthesis protein [Gammaproteobacteria bacterium]